MMPGKSSGLIDMLRSICRRSVSFSGDKAKPLAILFLGGLLVASSTLICVLVSRERRSDLPLTFTRVLTNNLGVREYEFTLKNRAWDCLLDAKVRICADPERARKRVKYHQGARLWPTMQMVDSRIQVASSTGGSLVRGETDIIRFSEPPHGPWMLSVYCVRTNTSSLLMALAEANRVANEKFGAPLLISLESARYRNSLLFDPLQGPTSLIERPR